MKAVVTGGAGFIGSHIVDMLLEKDFEVLVIDNFSSGNWDNLAKAKLSSKLQVVKSDILSQKCYSEINSFQPQYIFHYAGQISVKYSLENPGVDAHKNILATVELLKISQKLRVKKFIMASSAAVYGDQLYFPTTEEHTQLPHSPYGISKKCCEMYLDYYGKNSTMQTIALRFSNVYGPRQNSKGESGVMAIFFDCLIAQNLFTINGNGKQTRDFIFVKDVVNANIKCIFSEIDDSYSCFNVSSGSETSIVDLIRTSLKIAQNYQISPIEIHHGQELSGELKRSSLSYESIQKKIGWVPLTALEKGIEETCLYFRQI